LSQNFTAGQTQSYNWSTAIPSNLPPGTYYFVVAVFAPDWSTAYLWDQAVRLTVKSPFSDTGSASALQISRGQTENFSATVTAATAMSNVIVDLEIRDSSNVKILQNSYVSQNFAAGQTQSYNWSTAIPSNIPPGTYYFVVAVFAPEWSNAYLWDQAVQLTVKP
jgi:hypothetical protein